MNDAWIAIYYEAVNSLTYKPLVFMEKDQVLLNNWHVIAHAQELKPGAVFWLLDVMNKCQCGNIYINNRWCVTLPDCRN
ncbi:MAG: hypothetical protein KME29_39990 [Calothrix sp. FI2-JRJ7]|jgi:hypothetical protein|nr:hypothetical protein [Calothrix sp. FI2-JRJ7]